MLSLYVRVACIGFDRMLQFPHSLNVSLVGESKFPLVVCMSALRQIGNLPQVDPAFRPIAARAAAAL